MGNMVDRDFMHLWAGTKAVLLGIDPYDSQAWPDLRLSLGSSIVQDPACIYPMWTLLIFSPLALLPFPWAVSLWMTASEFALVASIFFLLVTLGCQRDRWLSLSALVGGMMFRPFIVSLTSGQAVPFILLAVAGALALYARGASFWSGILLGFVIIKPHLFILFLPAVALLFLARRDWRALAGLFSSVLLLFAISWLVSPGWPIRWLGVRDKALLTFGTPTLWGLAFDLAGPEGWITLGMLVLVPVSLATLFLIVRRHEDWRFGMGLAMCGSLFVTLYQWNYDQMLLLIPALIALCYLKARRYLDIALWVAVIFVIPWLLFWIANVRLFDSLSVLVTFSVAVYLGVSYWLGARSP